MYHEIKTERLLLRPFTPEDLEAVCQYTLDRENTRYTIWLPHRDRAETARYLETAAEDWRRDPPLSYEFAVTLDGTVIGGVSVALTEDRTAAELGWIINRRYWKRGYATEAALAARDFALRELKLRRLFAHCDAQNRDSYRLMERLGLKLEDDTGARTYEDTGETARELTYAMTIEQQENEG